MSWRPLAWTIGSLGVIIAFAAASSLAVTSLLRERRRFLMKQAEEQVASAATTVSTLVHERGRDIRNDMQMVIDARRRAVGAPQRAEIVRSHLIALNRSTRNYLRLWYLENGRVKTEVSGFRASDKPLPNVPETEVAEVDQRARSHPGTIAAIQALVPIDSPYDCLRLLGLASSDSKAAVVVLINMDAAFDALQSRASLPDLDLWVVDTDGSLLVDPESDHNVALQATLMLGPPNGQGLLGKQPSIWPFSDTGIDSQVVAWRTTKGQPFPWVTAVAAPLSGVTRRLHQMAVTVLLVAALVLMLVAATASLVVWLANHQAQLKERLEHLAMIEHMREQLLHLEKLSTMGQVTAGLAHEMGTPLGVIAIRVEQLIEQIADEKQRSALAIMRDEIERINRIIRQLLDTSRQATAETCDVQVRQAAEQVADLVTRRYESRGIKLHVGLPSDVRVHANPDQFRQVLLNLLVNAGDACKAGDRVTIQLCEDLDADQRVGIEVVDTGGGIEAQILSSVFEPFFTTKKPGEGTGLGLTIVREIMHQHEGSVELVSTGQGTRAITWWPPASVTQREATSKRHLVPPTPFAPG